MNATTKTAQIRLTRSSPGYWRITFDNPPLNLMGPEFVLELREIMTAIETDEELRVVVFDSAVEGFFLNHSDFLAKLEDLTRIPQGPTGLEAWPDILVRLTRTPVVTIALIRGRATGNGSEIALACDMSFASREKAVLSQWEVGVGLVAGGGPMAAPASVDWPGTRPGSAPWVRRHRGRPGSGLWLREQIAAGRRARRVCRCDGYPYRIIRQVGDCEHEAPCQRRQFAAGRRNRGRVGRLHGFDRSASCTGPNQGVV